MRRILLRSVLFVPAASALWALLPAVARGPLDLGADGYGVLLGALGVGAVAGALALPAVRARARLDHVLSGAASVYALGMLGLALASSMVVALPCLVLAGAAWVGVLSSLNASAQLVLPGWVRARALAYYLVVFFGGQAIGGVVWGLVASGSSTRAALVVAAVALLAATGFGVRRPLRTAPDPTPSTHWGDLPDGIGPEEGPVLVLVEYHVLPGDEQAFLAAMAPVGRTKQRTGGSRWSVYRDPDVPGRFVESFTVDTWAEHQRQHGGRLTVSDRLAEQHLQDFLTQPPVVSHLLATRYAAGRSPSAPGDGRSAP